MTTLMGQSCWALVAQALLVDLNVCRHAWVLRLLCQVGMAQWWTRGLGGDLGAHPVSSSGGLHNIGPMRALASLSASILVSRPLCFKLEHFIIYVFPLQLKNSCNNSLFGPCMCCIMRQCFSVDNSYGSWLALTILAQGWDVTSSSSPQRLKLDHLY
jgi:hypothetical protein